ncbi:hypothetical protein ACWEPV_14105, partial [Streptomyces cacaoi]
GKAFHDAVPAPLTPDRAPAAHGVHNATPAEAAPASTARRPVPCRCPAGRSAGPLGPGCCGGCAIVVLPRCGCGDLA